MRDRIIGLKAVSIRQLVGFKGGNPKQYTDEDREHLSASLDNHGYVLPIAVRDAGEGMYEVIDGHHRVEQIAAKSSDDSKIKVLVLDVEDSLEGRRILLALKHTADWDMKKLEDFVTETLELGATAGDLITDTGLTPEDLDAFMNAGAKLLEDDNESEDDDENERPSRAGLTTEHVAFSVEVSRDQSKSIRAAIKLAKQITGAKVHGDALTAICGFYASAHRKRKSDAKKKSKSKRASK